MPSRRLTNEVDGVDLPPPSSPVPTIACNIKHTPVMCNRRKIQRDAKEIVSPAAYTKENDSNPQTPKSQTVKSTLAKRTPRRSSMPPIISGFVDTLSPWKHKARVFKVKTKQSPPQPPQHSNKVKKLTTKTHRVTRRASMPTITSHSDDESDTLSPKKSQNMKTKIRTKRRGGREKLKSRDRTHSYGSTGDLLTLSQAGSSTSVISFPVSPASKLTLSLDMTWTKLPSMTFARQDCNAATIEIQRITSNGSYTSDPCGVIVVGGRNNIDDSTMNLAEFFDFIRKQWITLPSMTTARCGCSVAVVDNAVFVAGGIVNSKTLASAERLIVDSVLVLDQKPLEQERWKTIASMSTERSYCAAVGLADYSTIVVIGGRDHAWRDLNSVEAYDMSTNAWRPLKAMGTPRFGCAAVSLSKSKILVVGGFDGLQWSTSAQIYDYEADAWSNDVADMPSPLQFCSAAVLKREQKTFVFVTGIRDQQEDSDMESGSVDRSASECVYCYDVKGDRWITLSSSSDIPGCTLTTIGSQNLLAIGGCLSDLQKGIKDTRMWSIETDGFDINKHFDVDEDQTVSTKSSGVARRRGSETSTSFNRQDSTNSLGRWHDSVSSALSLEQDPCANHPLFSTPVSGRGGSRRSPCAVMKQGLSKLPTLPLCDDIAGDDTVDQEKEVNDDAERDSIDRAPEAIHPLFTMPAKTESLNVRRRRSSMGSIGKTWVENEEMLDNYGFQVSYTGQVNHSTGRPQGNGQMTWKLTGDVYTGLFRNGARDGSGRIAYANGDDFVGNFEDDQREGRGVYNYHDGRTYNGMYIDDEAEDTDGTMTWKDGTIYVGQFSCSKRTGFGSIRFPDNGKYEGEFRNGKYHGFGVFSFPTGSVYQGQWRKGKAYGHGQLVNGQGNVVHQGVWEKDVPKLSRRYSA